MPLRPNHGSPEDWLRMEKASLAVEIRYPGVSEEVTEKEYQEAFGLAEAVVAWVEKNI